jgi:hypothetical protein
MNEDVELEKAAAMAAALYAQQQREHKSPVQDENHNSWLQTAWTEQM